MTSSVLCMSDDEKETNLRYMREALAMVVILSFPPPDA
jgi:hypothetical protein